MIILVCGSRHWTDAELVERELGKYQAANHDLLILEGGARGADNAARSWAKEKPGVGWQPFPAEWKIHDPEWCAPPCRGEYGPYCHHAGFKRNQQMLDFMIEYGEEQDEQTLLLAFKDDFDTTLTRGGTEDMCRRADAAGVEWQLVSHGV